MRKNKGIILGVVIIGLLAIVGFIGFGLYSMEIEDHYGDLQEFYYKANDGDIIVNTTKEVYGVIEKDWKRIYVDQGQERTDLYNWVYQDGQQSDNLIYRPTLNPSDSQILSYSDLLDKIDKGQLELVVQN